LTEAVDQAVREAGLVALSAAGESGAKDLEQLMEALDIEYVPVCSGLTGLARVALHRYGKRRHKARLTLGDSFAYALVMQRDEPLLFQGNVFAQTDVKKALEA
jgi:ribonuclease VapC